MTPSFVIAFQPILDVETGQTLAQEALLRGPDGETAEQMLGSVPPARLYRFDAAIRTRAVAEALRLGLADTGAALSLNIFPGCVGDPCLGADRTLRDAEASGFPIDRLVFELSETEPVADPAALAICLVALQRRGARITLDDLGTGYGRAPLLQAWHADGAKLAREVIAGLDHDLGRHAETRSMLEELDRQGIAVAAEGVETTAEMQALQALGVRAMQGFLFARPEVGKLPVGEIPGRTSRGAAPRPAGGRRRPPDPASR